MTAGMMIFSRRIVERLFQRAKIAYSDEKLTGALPRLARASIEDVMAAVGRSELKASDVARAMYPDYKEERAAAMAVKPKAESGWFGLKRLTSVKFNVPGAEAHGLAIPIRGINSDPSPHKFHHSSIGRRRSIFQ